MTGYRHLHVCTISGSDKKRKEKKYEILLKLQLKNPTIPITIPITNRIMMTVYVLRDKIQSTSLSICTPGRSGVRFNEGLIFKLISLAFISVSCFVVT